MAKRRKNPQTTKQGHVRKVIPPLFPGDPEKVEIVVHEADNLFREVRIENRLEDAEGNKVKLKQSAEVDVTVEASEKDTTPTSA